MTRVRKIYSGSVMNFDPLLEAGVETPNKLVLIHFNVPRNTLPSVPVFKNVHAQKWCICKPKMLYRWWIYLYFCCFYIFEVKLSRSKGDEKLD